MQGLSGDAIAVSIHAPHEGERRLLSSKPLPLIRLFQSTLPTRGSDGGGGGQTEGYSRVSIHAPHEGERPPPVMPYSSPTWCFNPRSPRGGATLSTDIIHHILSVSIHAPHEGERRVDCTSGKSRPKLFQSTLPTRGSDKGFDDSNLTRYGVSIHAPHEGERRQGRAGRQAHRVGFNPRSPRGGATDYWPGGLTWVGVSIHAPHEGERPHRAASGG